MECFEGDGKVIYFDCKVKVIEFHTLNRCIIKLYLTEVDCLLSQKQANKNMTTDREKIFDILLTKNMGYT